MKKRNIVMMMCATALLSSCHIYKAYDRPEDISAEGIYRDPVSVTDTLAVTDTTNIGSLPSARLSFLPSINFAPQGSLTTMGDSDWGKAYSTPLAASWEVDLFGKLLNASRSQKTAYLQSKSFVELPIFIIPY